MKRIYAKDVKVWQSIYIQIEKIGITGHMSSRFGNLKLVFLNGEIHKEIGEITNVLFGRTMIGLRKQGFK